MDLSVKRMAAQHAHSPAGQRQARRNGDTTRSVEPGSRAPEHTQTMLRQFISMLHCDVTESQHGQGWKGPLWVI